MGQSGLLGMVEGQTERNTLQMSGKRISPARKVRQNLAQFHRREIIPRD
jgi:hypothetical protein